MHSRSILVGVLVAFVVTFPCGSAAPLAQSRLPLAVRLAHRPDLPPEKVEALLRAFGDEAGRDLQAGETIVLPGLGILRVVRIAEYKDLRDGRPVTMPAHNMVEFLPETDLIDAVNQSNTQPSVTVPAFEFNPRPIPEPGQRTPGMRSPGMRTRT
jgi:nucleoid DNA-binding protein